MRTTLFIFCVSLSLFSASSSAGLVTLNLGTTTTNPSLGLSESVQYLIGSTGDITIGTAYASWRALPAGSTIGKTVAGDFTLGLATYKHITTSTGAGTTAGTMTSNSLGIGVQNNPAGDYIGNASGNTEALIVSLDTLNLHSDYTLKLISVTLNAGTNSKTNQNGRVVSRLAGNAVTPIIPWGTSSLLTIDASALNIVLGGGKAATQLASIYEPATGATGWKVDNLVFDITIPEPATMSILGLGEVVLLRKRK